MNPVFVGLPLAIVVLAALLLAGVAALPVLLIVLALGAGFLLLNRGTGTR